MAIVWADGFAHQVFSATGFGNSNQKLFDTAVNPGAHSFVTGRSGSGYAMRQAQSTATHFGKDWAGATALSGVALGNTGARQVTESFWFRIPSAPAGTCSFKTYVNGTQNFAVRITSSGTLFCFTGGSGTATTRSYADGFWHLMDVLVDTSANPNTMTVRLDGGVEIITGSEAIAAQDINATRMGTVNSGDTLVWEMDDWVIATSPSDYPLGSFNVASYVPTGDGTHSAGTNIMENQAAQDINGTTITAYTLLNTWPPGTTNFVQQAAVGASNYAEVTFDDMTGQPEIAAVMALAAVFSDGTAINDGTTRVVDSGGTTLVDVFAGDMSETTLRYQARLVPDPGANGWSVTDFNGVKMRVGFSGDATPDPQWSGLMLQAAIRESLLPHLVMAPR